MGGELRPPTQLEDANFRMSTAFPQHCPGISPSANQKKVTHSVILIPNFAYKNFSLKTIQEFWVFEHEQSPSSLLRPLISLFLFQSRMFCFDWHTNLHLVTLTHKPCSSPVGPHFSKWQLHSSILFNTKVLKSFLTMCLLSHFICSPSANPVRSTFKLHPESSSPLLTTSTTTILSQAISFLAWIFDVNYKLALTLGTCHLLLQWLNHVLLQLFTFNTHWREFRWRAKMRH